MSKFRVCIDTGPGTTVNRTTPVHDNLMDAIDKLNTEIMFRTEHPDLDDIYQDGLYVIYKCIIETKDAPETGWYMSRQRKILHSRLWIEIAD